MRRRASRVSPKSDHRATARIANNASHNAKWPTTTSRASAHVPGDTGRGNDALTVSGDASAGPLDSDVPRDPSTFECNGPVPVVAPGAVAGRSPGSSGCGPVEGTAGAGLVPGAVAGGRATGGSVTGMLGETGAVGAETPTRFGPTVTVTERGTPGSRGSGPSAGGIVTFTATPFVGETVTEAFGNAGVVTRTGPTFTVAGTGGTVTETGTGTCTEIGPISRADAAPASATNAPPAITDITAIERNRTDRLPLEIATALEITTVRELFPAVLRKNSHPVATGKRRGSRSHLEERVRMTLFGHSARRRLMIVGLLAAPLAVAGWVGTGVAQGATGTAPSMEVLPSTGLKYSQTVEVKGHHLPKGSGSTAATICGLQDAAGKTIANPGADDCAGASEVGKLVIVKSWQSNGEFDTQYTLPASGQKFGTNNRFCDKTHKCAVVVADANPSSPAYHVQEAITFADQASTTTTTKPKTTTTKPTTTKPTTTPTTHPTTAPPTTAPATTGTAQPPASGGSTATGSTNSASVNGNVSASVPASGSGSGSGVNANVGVTIQPPSTSAPSLPPVTVPSIAIPAPVAAALNQACGQLATVVKQAGGDPSLLTASCASLAGGNGPQELALVLQSPALLCIEGASAWQNNAQITAACTQAATALAPITAPLAGELAPLLASI